MNLEEALQVKREYFSPEIRIRQINYCDIIVTSTPESPINNNDQSGSDFDQFFNTP